MFRPTKCFQLRGTRADTIFLPYAQMSSSSLLTVSTVNVVAYLYFDRAYLEKPKQEKEEEKIQNTRDLSECFSQGIF